jgi:NAD+ synthase (glutamine-hydrolysing)
MNGGKSTKLFNSAVVIRDGHVIGRYNKTILPNYDVFDECRYFSVGNEPLVFECNGVKIGIVICEDMWHEYPIKASVNYGAELVCVLNASPYEVNKQQQRIAIARSRVIENKIPLIYVNQVGGQDDLVFDGASFALDNMGNLVLQLPAFITATDYVNYTDLTGRNSTKQPMEDLVSKIEDMIVPYPDKIASIYQALVLALKDYVNKNGFKGIALGLSGGIDSALTCAIAYDALGPHRIMAVMMPSIYTSDMSNIDAKAMIDILQIKATVVPIEEIVTAFKNGLKIPFLEFSNDSKVTSSDDTTFENLQARSRGVILMAISNHLGYLVVTTGNKSEMAVGYATLYGDMAGGFALLKDVDKTTVYALSRYRNAQSYIIPDRIIIRAPSAELRENQIDQDSLPEYAVLDQILEMLVVRNLSPEEVILNGFPKDLVSRVVNLLKNSEHKRSQAAIGPKITLRSFGSEWRMPITNQFK